jgi:AraC family transcriptional regulator
MIPSLQKDNQPQVPSASPLGTDFLRILMMSDEPGVIESPAVASTSVAIHVGLPSRIACRRGGESHRGTAIHGDIDIIPSGIPSRWELKDKDMVFVLSVSPKLVRVVAEERGLDPARVEIRNRFQVRDLQIEHIGWAAKTEMERGFPCGRLYLDSLATALAAHLISDYSVLSGHPGRTRTGLPGRKLKQVLAFIEENLGHDLSLAEIANAASLSVSHCKVLFRQSVGLPVHQYVIRRRVERAVSLLREGNLPISQIALESGFAHQSHLAMHMRRILGISPKTFRDNLQ